METNPELNKTVRKYRQLTSISKNVNRTKFRLTGKLRQKEGIEGYLKIDYLTLGKLVIDDSRFVLGPNKYGLRFKQYFHNYSFEAKLENDSGDGRSIVLTFRGKF
jgi:hypothetical protein